MITQTNKNLLSSTRFSVSKENEQAHAGRDGQTCLARPNSKAQTGTGKTSKTGSLTRLMYTLLKIENIHTSPSKSLIM